MRNATTCFLIFFLHCTGFTQQAKQYSFRHFSVSQGLASNTVNAVVQDKNGFIWMATVNGLQRYDGGSFISFKSKKEVPGTIASDRVSSLYSDKANNLWMVNDLNRVGLFDPVNFKYQETPIPNRGQHTIQQFVEMQSGELVVLLSDGRFFRFDPTVRRFVADQKLLPLPKGWGCNQVTWDEVVKKYWMSCDSGLVQYDPRTKQLNYHGHNPDNDPVIKAFGKQVALGVLTANGDVIFNYWPPGDGPRFYRYNRKKNKAEVFQFGAQLGYYEPKAFLVQRNGRLWIMGMPFLAEWPEGSSVIFPVANEYRNEQSIKFDYAYQASEDREGNIWVATDNGVFMFNPDAQVFNSYTLVRTDSKTPVEVSVTAVSEMQNGNILVGCWGSGVFCYDQKFNPVPLPRGFGEKGKTLSVWDMAVHPKTKDLWITLQGGGIAVYDEKKDRLTVLYPEIFKRSTIRQVDEDTAGNLWFGTQSGLVVKWDYLKAGNDPGKGYELVLKTGMVHKVHYEYQGYIWVATNGHGLLKINANTKRLVKRFTDESPEGERLFMNSPGDMTYYNDSTLLVSAGCINVVNTKTDKIHFITSDDGLPSNTTESIENDGKGILWMGMTNGICRMDLSKKLIAYYDRRDGIAYDKFNMGGAKELKDGRLVFFTDHNFLVFNPSLFGTPKAPPTPIITGFRLGGKSLSIDSIGKYRQARLKYTNTSIAINFSALTYLQQQKIYYYYKLENLDEEWIRSDKPLEVMYNSLSPGNYIFKVKTETAGGVQSQNMAVFPISVRAPIWKTWWFYSLLVLIALGILYLIDRERMKRIRALQQVRRQIRSNLRDEVSTTLNNINVLSEIAKIKADKNVEQAKDFIDQISDKSRHMMEAMDDTLWSIDPANDNMKKIVLRIKELTEGLRISSGKEIDLIVDNKVQSMELGMKLRHELFFFYKEAMQYIVNHIACDQIFVNLNKVRSRLMIEILTECQENAGDLRSKFRDAISKRVEALPATLDIIADNKSFAVVLYVEV